MVLVNDALIFLCEITDFLWDGGETPFSVSCIPMASGYIWAVKGEWFHTGKLTRGTKEKSILFRHAETIGDCYT